MSTRFQVGDFARVKKTKVSFQVTAVSEDGETIEGHPRGPMAASFCRRVQSANYSGPNIPESARKKRAVKLRLSHEDDRHLRHLADVMKIDMSAIVSQLLLMAEPPEREGDPLQLRGVVPPDSVTRAIHEHEMALLSERLRGEIRHTKRLADELWELRARLPTSTVHVLNGTSEGVLIFSCGRRAPRGSAPYVGCATYEENEECRKLVTCAKCKKAQAKRGKA